MNRRESTARFIRRTGTILALVGGLGTLVHSSAANDDRPTLLRVGTSGDYAPFSMAYGNNVGTSWNPQGFDIAVAKAYAADRNLDIEWVQFRWPQLRSDLARKRFDVAMSGITQRPERSLIGIYTVPVATTGAVALVRDAKRFAKLGDLNQPGVKIGVNRGGHLERVTRARFPRADIQAVSGNDAVPQLLVDGDVNAVVSDTLEAPHWQLGRSGISRLGPFSRDEKSYLVRIHQPELALDLDQWLLAAEANGTLDKLRRVHLGRPARPQPATPTMALLASVEERLSLMPLVAASKNARNQPIEDPEREAEVLRKVIQKVDEDAQRRGHRPPSQTALEHFFRVQMELAKTVQRATLERLASGSTAGELDLQGDLRPALDRIGSRMARLLTRLPSKLDLPTVERQAAEVLAFSDLDADQINAIAKSIVEVAHSEGDDDSVAVPNRVLSQ